MEKKKILDDTSALRMIKETSRPLYLKAWQSFKNHFDAKVQFDDRMPDEDELLRYFSHLREEQGLASTTLWTTYSKINSVCKNKYGRSLQEYPRVTTLIKSYNTDVKKKLRYLLQVRSKNLCQTRRCLVHIG